MHVIKFLFVLYSIIFLSAHSFAASTEAAILRESLVAQLEALEVDSTIPIPEQLKQYDKILQQSRDNQWQELTLSAAGSIISLLIALEKIDEANLLIEQYRPLAEELKVISSTLQFKFGALHISDAKGTHAQSVMLREELLAIAKTLQAQEDVANTHVNIAKSQIKTKDLQLALKNLQKAQQIFADLDNEQGLALTLNSMASILSSMEDYNGAIEYFRQALLVTRKLGERFNESVAVYNLATTLGKVEKFDEGIAMLEQAAVISKELNDYVGLAWTEKVLGKFHLALGNTEKALRFFQSAAQVFKEVGDERSYFTTQLGTVKSLTQLNRLEEAFQIILELKPIVASLSVDSFTSDYIKVRAKAEQVAGNYQAALNSQLEYIELKEKLFKQQKQKGLQELMVKFDLDKKITENNMLQKENELQTLRLEKQSKQQTISMLFMSLSGLVIFGIATMLYKQIQNRNRFRRMALRDHLTRAPNRRAILEYANERFMESRATQANLTLALIDLDHFKRFNDTYGHDVGDEVLKVFAQTCRSVLRNQDRFGRYGGEEWLVVLSDTPESDIEIIFNRLKEHLSKIHNIVIPSDAKITFSMGVAQLQVSDNNLSALIKRADDNLYRAKELGRNRYVA